MLQFQARLAALFPGCVLHHFSGALLEPGGVPQGARVAPLVANAAVWDDQFGWHRDAQPAEAAPDSPWAARFGLHQNREPGAGNTAAAICSRKLICRPRLRLMQPALTAVAPARAGRPRLVSAVLYLNPEWRLEWDAETLFVDPPTAAGLLVRPAPGRVALMDQDVLHRLSAPSVRGKKRSRGGGAARWGIPLLMYRPAACSCVAEPGPECCLSVSCRVARVLSLLSEGGGEAAVLLRVEARLLAERHRGGGRQRRR